MIHYDDVMWTSCSLKSPVILLLVKQIPWPTSKKRQSPRYWWWGKPPPKGRWCWICFHLMTSSWYRLHLMTKLAWIDGYWTGIKLNYTTLSQNFHFIKYSIQIGMKYYKTYTLVIYLYLRNKHLLHPANPGTKQTTANIVITVYTTYIKDCCDIIARLNIENKIPYSMPNITLIFTSYYDYIYIYTLDMPLYLRLYAKKTLCNLLMWALIKTNHTRYSNFLGYGKQRNFLW